MRIGLFKKKQKEKKPPRNLENLFKNEEIFDATDEEVKGGIKEIANATEQSLTTQNRNLIRALVLNNIQNQRHLDKIDKRNGYLTWLIIGLTILSIWVSVHYADQSFLASVQPNIIVAPTTNLPLVSATTTILQIQNQSPAAIRNLTITPDLLFVINSSSPQLICSAGKSIYPKPNYSIQNMPANSTYDITIPLEEINQIFSGYTKTFDASQVRRFLRLTINYRNSITGEPFPPDVVLFGFTAWTSGGNDLEYGLNNVANDSDPFSMVGSMSQGIMPLTATTLYDQLKIYDTLIFNKGCYGIP